MSESPQSAPEVQHSPTLAEKLAAWVQFPRRVIFLLIAFFLASILITALRLPLLAGAPSLSQNQDWELSWRSSEPIVEVIATKAPNTLLLLSAAFFLALLLAILTAFVGILVHRLEQATGPLGSVLKGLGRVVCLAPAVAPVAFLSLYFIFSLAFQLKLLPAAGMMSPLGEGNLSDIIQHLVLPASTLALLPGMLTAQAWARDITLFQAPSSGRVWLARLFKLLGVLLGQIGGWLTASIVVEMVFAWPGLGRLIFDSAITRDYPVLLGVLGAYAGIILGWRLAAELFRWLERLLQVRLPDIRPQVAKSPWRKTARRVWVVVTLLLLIAPLGLGVAGLTAGSTNALDTDVKARNAPPSSDHPWGTDSLGRDLQARVLRGGLTTLGITALAAIIALIPALAGGALTGFLASRGKLWSESLADLLLLPADVLMFLPALAGVMVIMLSLFPEGEGWLWLALGVAGVLIPRALRFYQTLWMAEPKPRRWLLLSLVGAAALLLGMMFAGFGLITSVDFLGLGIQPPQPSLGNVLTDQRMYLTTQPAGLFAAGYTLWLCAVAFYMSADALVGYFYSKEPLARLNE